MKRQQMNIRHISNPKQSKYPKKREKKTGFLKIKKEYEQIAAIKLLDCTSLTVA